MVQEPPVQSSEPRLRMKGVCKSFGPTVALEGVELVVNAGEVHGLIGENGAGKSTLMKALSGAHRIDAGEMWIDGEPYCPSSPHEGRKAGVAMIYQELSLAPHLSVMENIVLGAEPVWGPLVCWSRVRELAEDALAKVGLETLDIEVKAGRLSNARQQLVEIARAVAFGARILVLDEPTSSLAQQDVERLFGLVRSLRERGYAIIYISHFLEEIQQITDRFTVLRDGRSVGNGTTGTTRMRDIVSLMVGRNVDELYPRSRRSPGEVTLSFNGLGGRWKPREASLELRRGEVVGIAGVVGAGRTEMLRAVFGLDPVQKGTVRLAAINGCPTPSQCWRHGAGMLSEDRKCEGLALEMSIADNVMLPAMPGFITRGRQLKCISRWLERMRIKCASPLYPVNSLSGGNQQKAALARLLYSDVDVLLLDEPTRGIDVGSKAEIYRLIDTLACGSPEEGRAPKSILMVSSYLPELLGVCDRIAVMHRGVLGQARPVSAWNEHAIMLEATGAETLV